MFLSSRVFWSVICEARKCQKMLYKLLIIHPPINNGVHLYNANSVNKFPGMNVLFFARILFRSIHSSYVRSGNKISVFVSKKCTLKWTVQVVFFKLWLNLHTFPSVFYAFARNSAISALLKFFRNERNQYFHKRCYVSHMVFTNLLGIFFPRAWLRTGRSPSLL